MATGYLDTMTGLTSLGRKWPRNLEEKLLGGEGKKAAKEVYCLLLHTHSISWKHRIGDCIPHDWLRVRLSPRGTSSYSTYKSSHWVTFPKILSFSFYQFLLQQSLSAWAEANVHDYGCKCQSSPRKKIDPRLPVKYTIFTSFAGKKNSTVRQEYT